MTAISRPPDTTIYWLSACCLGLGLLTTNTHSAVNSNHVIEEIQVTATRNPAPIDEVPAPIHLIDDEWLMSNTLALDALAFQPGTYLQQTTPGQAAVIMRGLKGSEVLQIVDGMRVNNAIFRTAPTQYFALIPPSSVQRMEVMRGSGTAVYGNDAMAGVVQVLSRMPEFDTSENSMRRDIAVTASSAELLNSVQGTIEAGNNKYSVLTSLDYLQVGNRRTGEGSRIDSSSYRSRARRLAFLAKPTDGQHWLLDYQYLQQPATPRVDELQVGFGQNQPASAEYVFKPNDRTFVHLSHARSIGNAEIDIDASWQRIDDDRQIRGFQSSERRFEKNRSDLFGITIDGRFSTEKVDWLVGAEHYRDRVTSSRSQINIASGAVQELASRFPNDSHVVQSAAYAHGTYVQQNHSIQAGLRYTRYDIRLAGSTNSPRTNLNPGEFSAEFGWLFDMSDHLALSLTIARGVRAPNIFDLGTLGERPGNRFNIPNTRLRPEKVDQIDVGVRTRGVGWRFQANGFYLNYKDRITSVLIGAQNEDGRDLVQNQNLAEAQLYGIELNSYLQPLLLLGSDSNSADRFRIGVGLNYTRGKEKRPDRASTPADRIPPLNGELTLSYQSTTLLLEAFAQFATSQSRLSLRDEVDPRINPAGTPGWGTTNLQLTYTPNSTWKFRLGVENLFDKRYRVHGSGIDAVGRNILASAHVAW
ncbi:MAG: TonB-dependent receptor [Pseudomonadales bacterium]